MRRPVSYAENFVIYAHVTMYDWDQGSMVGLSTVNVRRLYVSADFSS